MRFFTRQAMLAGYPNLVGQGGLRVQPLLWGVRDGVEVMQRPDDFLILR